MDADEIRDEIFELKNKFDQARDEGNTEKATNIADKIAEKEEELEKAESFDEVDEIVDNLNQPADTPASQKGSTSEEVKTADDDLGSAAHAELLEDYFTKGYSDLEREEKSIFNTLRDDEGGYTVPEEMRQELIRNMENVNHIREQAEVISIESGSVRFPVMDTEEEPTWVGENETNSEVDASNTFGTQRWEPHKLAHIVKITEELLQDNAINVSDRLLERFAELFGKAEEKAFIKGDGDGKPKGLLSGDISGTAASGTTSFNEDDIMKLIYSIKQQYRDNGVFLMSRQAVQEVRLLKDANEQFLWQPGLQQGQPDTLAGYPVLETEYMVDPNNATSGDAHMIFGDLSTYRITDRINLTTQRLDEKYIEDGVIGFRMTKRVDGKPTLDEPVEILEAA